MAGGKPQLALPHFEKAYVLSGHRSSTILGLAQCHRVLKSYDRALELYAGLEAETVGIADPTQP